MTRLYLIRHGEATSQTSEYLRDDGLTELGVQQAERLRDRLATTEEIKPDVLIASSLPRARQTAEIIAPALKKPIEFDDEVQELRMGEAEGLHIEEFKARYGRYNLDREPFIPVSPGGENWGMFVLRVATALDRILKQHQGKSIVIVCHGGVVDSSFFYFFHFGTLTMPDVRLFTNNTSITEWRHESRSADIPPHWRLVRYNDDLHVRDIGSNARFNWEALRPQRGPRQDEDKPTISPTEK